MKSLKTLLPVLKPLLGQAGELYLVGGVLRDAYLDRSLKDVDISVRGDALAAAKKLGASLKARPFPLDEERGVYRVVRGEQVFDFAKWQGATLEKDLGRRDFTINAMALPVDALSGPLDKQVVDLFDGMKDLKSRRLRVTHPRVLQEDPLRMMRAFRLAAELDFVIEPKTLSAIKKEAKRLRQSAGERVREELMKIFATPRSARTLRAMDKAGLLSVFLPEAEEMRRTAHDYYGKEGVLGHSLDALASFEDLMGRWEEYFPGFHQKIEDYINQPVAGHPRRALLKITELLHDVGKPGTAKVENGKMHFYGHDHLGGRLSTGIAGRLKFSNEETKSISRMVNAHMRPGNLGHQPALTDRAVFRFFRDLESDGVGMLLVALGDHFTYLSEKEKKSKKDPVFLTIQKMLAKHFLSPESVNPPRLIDGNDLMRQLKLKEGPRIGALLNAIREAQAARRVRTRQDALALAKRLAAAKESLDEV